MRKVQNFQARLDEATSTKNPLERNQRLSAQNGAMLSILPHHPKSLALANENKEEPEEFEQVIDRFRCDLLTAMRGQNRLIKHELCNSLKLLESIVRVIGVSNVYYRLLMAINIFKNVKGAISDTEREQAKAGLFSSPDDYVEETAKLIAEVVAEIRSLVGMKQLHEAIATSWNLVRSNPGKVDDIVVVGNDCVLTGTGPSDVVSNVVTSSLSALEMASTSLPKKEATTMTYIPTEMHWVNPELELHSCSTSSVTVHPSNTTNHDIFENNVDQPTSSSRSTELNCANLMDSLSMFFPENHETITKHLFELLRSDKSNNELQGELIDLLGFEQFEMVGKVLDARYQLVDELKSARQDAANLSKYMPEKEGGKNIY
ncbi:hypothetical protein RB195_020141 [Necator americanus]